MDIIQDRDGFIWVATFGGASRFDGIHFRNYTSSKGLAVNKVNAVFQDSKGQIWFGTLGGGLCYLDNNRFRYISEKDGLPNNNVNAITEDQDGNMWFGTDGGISRFDGSSLENFGSDSGGQLTHVTDILITRSGAVYASTTVSGCYKFNGKSFVRIKDAFS
ncbi:MAG: two-component regulator propeller domain-containing protein, partial [Flavobacteriales bacterium]